MRLLALFSLLLLAGGAAAQSNVALAAFGAALRGANASALSTWTGAITCTSSSSGVYTSNWQGVYCDTNIVTRVRLSGLLLNGSLSCDVASVSTLTFLDLGDNQLTGSIPSCLFGLTSLVALDLSRNWLTGPLPALTTTLTSGRLFLSVFDNQIQGTVPSNYTVLRALAVAMNPGLYGPWPNGLEPASFTVPGATGGLCQNNAAPVPWSVYGSAGWVKGAYSGGLNNAKGWNYPDCCDCQYSPIDRSSLTSRGTATYSVSVQYPPTASDVHNRVGMITYGLYAGWYPSYASGFYYGTSLGLDEPLYVLLRRIAAAFDPTGTLLPSWASGIQPCLPTWGSGQRSTSPGFGQAWVGVAPYCVDGTYAGNPMGGAATGPTGGVAGGAWGWQAGSSGTQWATGGIGQLTLTGLGLNGTLPDDLRLLRTVSVLDLSQNFLTGSIPAAWGLPVAFANFAPTNLTSGPSKIVNSPINAALGLPLLLRIDLNRNALSGA